MAAGRNAKCKMFHAKCKVRQTGSRGKGASLTSTRQIALLLGGLAHRFKGFQSRVERLGRTGPDALTCRIRVKLDALRLCAESRVMFKQRSQSIRNTDGG